ncbi:hypothetical protein MK805_07170 [Shimazuella sp. AN120528]|uniref:hypothetical protein n=1 Tax=Shimazuella soli TaxID=1892854 RepID=UPI001F115B7C|nr:hypothetical protein [Shimazuella soli]MCH5584751.1 hypothetical protein [Shimazuella soli]
MGIKTNLNIDVSNYTRYLDVAYHGCCKKCGKMTNLYHELNEYKLDDKVAYKLGATLCKSCIDTANVIISADVKYLDYFEDELYHYDIESVHVKWE